MDVSITGGYLTLQAADISGMNFTGTTPVTIDDARDLIELNHRIVLSPFAAKRRTELLQQLMKEYETRYGVLAEK